MKETDLQREVLSVLAQTISDCADLVEITKYEVNAFDETLAVLHFGHSTTWEKLNEFQDLISFYRLEMGHIYLGNPSEIWIHSVGKVNCFAVAIHRFCQRFDLFVDDDGDHGLLKDMGAEDVYYTARIIASAMKEQVI